MSKERSLAELFYPEAGYEFDNSLRTFIDKALELIKPHGGQGTVEFNSERYCMDLKINRSFDVSELVGMRVKGHSKDLSEILSQLDGHIGIVFKENFYLKNPPKIKNLKKGDKGRVQQGNFDLEYIMDGKGLLVSRAELKRQKDHEPNKLWSVVENPAEVFDEDSIFNNAAHIEVYLDFFVNDDPRDVQVKLECEIRKSEDKYLWDLNINTSQNIALPYGTIRHILNVYDLIKKEFDDSVLRGARVI